ncbi:S8 family peptidase [Okeania sp. KiyG1]|uniref:S8 family peptidase n=1 Tax=Okeania sp. KiyG1 TaxID=2720165 RepID=UPI0019232D08|nr:S8 family peptidase [Okeania sp. KiyG1]GGA31837.1 serine protease [Okeania sp. KiyG1]
MNSQFEHLQLPRTNIELPKRIKGGGGGNKRDNREYHGRKLLAEVSTIIEKPVKEYAPFGINPKLIFKLKLRSEYSLQDKQVTGSGLNILEKGSKSDEAIVVFSSDDNLTEFRRRLKCYSGLIDNSYEYGYLDAIEELVRLEPQDRIGPLLNLEPLEPGELVPLDLELWHTGNLEEMQDYINNLNEFLSSFEEYPGMRVTDRYIGEYMCIARMKIRQEVLEILLAEDAVKEIDRRPKPAFENSSQLSISISEFPELISPPIDACGVLVIDSGVQRGHPLIGPALGDTEVFPDPNHTLITGGPDDGDKTGGHGTGVSGVAIYGNLFKCLEEENFQPQVWLFSARVTNENNEYYPDLLLENQLEKAVAYFTDNYPNCKVINISLGNRDSVYRDGQKQFLLAAKIDEISYRLQHKNILFVISAGNFYYQPESKELLRQEYPSYLFSENSQIIEPATAAIALTVGSLSMGKGSLEYPEDASRNVIAKVKGYPSPFTRIGFGVDGMIKPELVDFGGDFVLDRSRIIDNERGVSILTLNKNFQGSQSLFRAYCGTSFAAPRVANLAARLFTKFPNASSNLIRALIADSADIPEEIPDDFQDDEKQQLKVYGYGQSNFEKAAYSTENGVVLLEDNREIFVGKFHIYEIPPLPPEFLEKKGNRTISVTLAFDPPTRHTRGDSYLGITMEFHLFRNVEREKIQRAFFKATQEDENNNLTEISIGDLKKEYGSNVEVNLLPKVTIRKKGTLQKGSIKISSRSWKYNGKSMYLVVICNRKWSRIEEIEVQRYALVASIRHSNPEVNLYNKLRSSIAQRGRVR